MEAIAIDVKTNLQGQTQKMQHIDRQLGGLNSDLTHSDKAINDIKRIRKTNRLILLGVGTTILIAVILVVVLKFV